MDTALAIIKLIAVSVSIWKNISDAVNAFKNAPDTILHWKITGEHLQTALLLVEEAMNKKTHSYLRSESNHFEAMKDQLDSFNTDLASLQRMFTSLTLHSSFGKLSVPKQAWATLEAKLKDEPDLKNRIDRHIQLLHLSVSLLSLLDPNPKTKVDCILHNLKVTHPQASGDDEKFRKWKESANEIMEDAGLSKTAPTSATTDQQSNMAKQQHRQSASGTDENFDMEELLDRFEIAQDFAKRLDEAKIPTLASNYQLKAIGVKEQLRKMSRQPFHMVEHVALEERYILMLISCQIHDDTFHETALNRLTELASTVDVVGRNELYHERQKIGALYINLKEYASAIPFLRFALFDGFLQQDLAKYDDDIRQTSRLLYKAYECCDLRPELDATKIRVRREFGKDPIASSPELSEALKWCERKGFNVSEKDQQLVFHALKNYDGRTPLHEAALNSKMDMKVLKYLMLPDYLSLRDDFGDTALLLAADRSNFKVVEMLLSIPYLVHVRDQGQKQTPLHRCKDQKTLNILIKAIACRNSIPPGMELEPVDIDSPDCSQRTALHLACQQGRVDLVETLVTHKANVNLVCITGDTPLLIACRTIDTKKSALEAIIRHLVNHEANCKQTDTRGKDPRTLLKARRFSDSAITRLFSIDPVSKFRYS